MTRNSNLDIFRGFAVLLVFLSHSSGRSSGIIEFLNFHGIGHIGVYMFFSLSSYLMIKTYSNNGSFTKDALKFYVKRVGRIVPVYYLILLAIILKQYLIGVNSEYNHINDTVSHFAFYDGNGVFWSIVVEFQFYLLFPILYLLTKKSWGRVVLICLITISSIMYTGEYFLRFINIPVELLKYLSPNKINEGMYLDIFLVPIIFETTSNKTLIKIKTCMNKYGLIITMILMPLIILSTSKIIFKELSVFYGLRFVSIFFGLLFYSTIISLKSAPEIKKFKILREIGIYGFSIYLIHMSILEFINFLMPENILIVKFLMAGTMTFYVSKIIYSYVELPSIDLYRKINSKILQ